MNFADTASCTKHMFFSLTLFVVLHERIWGHRACANTHTQHHTMDTPRERARGPPKRGSHMAPIAFSALYSRARHVREDCEIKNSHYIRLFMCARVVSVEFVFVRARGHTNSISVRAWTCDANVEHAYASYHIICVHHPYTICGVMCEYMCTIARRHRFASIRYISMRVNCVRHSGGLELWAITVRVCVCLSLIWMEPLVAAQPCKM